jgi:hypothetical protein
LATKSATTSAPTAAIRGSISFRIDVAIERVVVVSQLRNPNDCDWTWFYTYHDTNPNFRVWCKLIQGCDEQYEPYVIHRTEPSFDGGAGIHGVESVSIRDENVEYFVEFMGLYRRIRYHGRKFRGVHRTTAARSTGEFWYWFEGLVLFD